MPNDNWVFKAFISDRRVNEVEKWISGLPAKDRAKIRTFIQYLKTQRVWKPAACKKYKRSDKIYELRIRYGNIQYRPLGCYGPGEKVFTLLIGAEEKGGELIPRDAYKIAEERRIKVFGDSKYVKYY